MSDEVPQLQPDVSDKRRFPRRTFFKLLAGAVAGGVLGNRMGRFLGSLDIESTFGNITRLEPVLSRTVHEGKEIAKFGHVQPDFVNMMGVMLDQGFNTEEYLIGENGGFPGGIISYRDSSGTPTTIQWQKQLRQTCSIANSGSPDDSFMQMILGPGAILTGFKSLDIEDIIEWTALGYQDDGSNGHVKGGLSIWGSYSTANGNVEFGMDYEMTITHNTWEIQVTRANAGQDSTTKILWSQDPDKFLEFVEKYNAAVAYLSASGYDGCTLPSLPPEVPSTLGFLESPINPELFNDPDNEWLKNVYELFVSEDLDVEMLNSLVELLVPEVPDNSDLTSRAFLRAHKYDSPVVDDGELIDVSRLLPERLNPDSSDIVSDGTTLKQYLAVREDYYRNTFSIEIANVPMDYANSLYQQLSDSTSQPDGHGGGDSRDLAASWGEREGGPFTTPVTIEVALRTGNNGELMIRYAIKDHNARDEDEGDALIIKTNLNSVVVQFPGEEPLWIQNMTAKDLYNFVFSIERNNDGKSA